MISVTFLRGHNVVKDYQKPCLHTVMCVEHSNC